VYYLVDNSTHNFKCTVLHNNMTYSYLLNMYLKFVLKV
jgi:hypothetical protein